MKRIKFNEAECKLLKEIYDCKSMDALNGVLSHFESNDENLVLETLKKVNDDFLIEMISASELIATVDFLRTLIDADPKKTKQLIESIPIETWKELIRKASPRQCMLFYRFLAYDIFAFTLLKNTADLVLIGQKAISLQDLMHIYEYLYHVKKFDKEYPVMLDIELIIKASKQSTVFEHISAVKISAGIGKEFLRTFLEIIPIKAMFSIQGFDFAYVSEILEVIYDTDRELFEEVLEKNKSLIKINSITLSDSGRYISPSKLNFFELMYKTGHADELVNKQLVKEDLERKGSLDPLARFLLIASKYDIVTAAELCPCFFRNKNVIKSFDYEKYMQIKEPYEKLIYLKKALEQVYSLFRKSPLLWFFFFFTRNQLLEISNRLDAETELKLPDFIDIKIDEEEEKIFKSEEEGEEYARRLIDKSNLREKEDMLLEMKQFEGEYIERLANRLNEVSDKIKENFEKRYKDYVMSESPEKISILADIFSLGYSAKYRNEFKHRKMINELDRAAALVKKLSDS